MNKVLMTIALAGALVAPVGAYAQGAGAEPRVELSHFMSAYSVADEVVERHGVKIMGFSNTPAHLAADASALYARNLYNFLSAFWDKEQGRPVLDDEIGNAVRLTRGGEIVNERIKG